MCLEDMSGGGKRFDKVDNIYVSFAGGIALLKGSVKELQLMRDELNKELEMGRKKDQSGWSTRRSQ